MSWKLLKILKMLVFVVLAVAVFGYVTRDLWNWLVPGIFGLRTITFWQAIGLVVLGKILFGGFHRHGPGGGRRGGRDWKRHMKQRWESMSVEERERFRAGMRERRGRGWCDRGGRERFAEEMFAKDAAASAAEKGVV